MVYGAALERRFRGNSIEGSNPSPSAMKSEALNGDSFFICNNLVLKVI